MFWSYFFSRPAAAFGLFFAFIAVSSVLGATCEAARLARYAGDVYPVKGHVTASFSGSRGASASLQVAYADRTGGAHQTTLAVPGTRHSRTHVGDEVPLFVSARDPNEAFDGIDGPPSSSGVMGRMMCSGIWAVIAIILGLRAASAASGRLRVLSSGVPVDGEVVSRKPGRSRTTRRRSFIRYAWAFEGKRYEGESIAVPEELCGALTEGARVAVFVDPSDPSHGEIDPFGFRAQRGGALPGT